MNATDGDRGLFGELRYSLEIETANCQGLFSINPLWGGGGGVINTTQEVDREATPTCLLVVTAMDNGGVNLTDSRLASPHTHTHTHTHMYTNTHTLYSYTRECVCVCINYMQRTL